MNGGCVGRPPSRSNPFPVVRHPLFGSMTPDIADWVHAKEWSMIDEYGKLLVHRSKVKLPPSRVAAIYGCELTCRWVEKKNSSKNARDAAEAVHGR
jgi:hypothetical protein